MADTIPAEQWKTRPEADVWSAGEVIAHLISIEGNIVTNAARIIQHEPKPFPLLKRFHVPMILVEMRVIKRKTPIPLDLGTIGEKILMLAELNRVREQTLSFIDETRHRDLGAYCWPHLFLGTLNLYNWLQLVASHEIRHTKQMKEIAANLQKKVANLQK